MRNLNKPTRYNVASIQAQQTLGGDVMQADEEGQYVTWRDYAWLLAEVERLKEGNECLDQMHEKEMARSAYLCEQVERLRKAGDAMASSIQFNEEMEKDYDGETIVHPSVERWNEAKEGKQS